MNKTELKNYLYRQFINQLYYENGTEKIEPGTTIRLKWESSISISEKGAKFLNKEMKELDEIVNS